MPRHPLLPDNYTDSTLQSAILFALSPYKIEGQGNANNPKQKWNLSQAWLAAKTQFERGIAKHTLAIEREGLNGEILAYTEQEIDDINTLIAGIVAYQILEPDSGMALHRIDYRKGGEVALILPDSATQLLLGLFPHLKLAGGKATEQARWWQRLWREKA